MEEHLFKIHHKIYLKLNAICQEAGDMNVEEFLKVYEELGDKISQSKRLEDVVDDLQTRNEELEKSNERFEDINNELFSRNKELVKRNDELVYADNNTRAKVIEAFKKYAYTEGISPGDRFSIVANKLDKYLDMSVQYWVKEKVNLGKLK